MGKIVAVLHRLGVDKVFDTATGADLTVMEEAAEFVDRLEKGGVLPLMTSCCPSWVSFVEKKYPEILPNISHLPLADEYVLGGGKGILQR